jgi:hypothetical protein
MRLARARNRKINPTARDRGHMDHVSASRNLELSMFHAKGADMSLTSSLSVASASEARPRLEKSYDLKVLISVGLMLIGIVVAIVALTGHHGVSGGDLGLMTAWP